MFFLSVLLNYALTCDSPSSSSERSRNEEIMTKIPHLKHGKRVENTNLPAFKDHSMVLILDVNSEHVAHL